MGPANRHCMITVITEDVRNCLFTGRQIITIIVDAVATGIGSGQDRGPGRHANRTLNVKVFVPDAAFGQFVKVGCFYHRVTGTTEKVGALVVRAEDNNIGFHVLSWSLDYYIGQIIVF